MSWLWGRPECPQFMGRDVILALCSRQLPGIAKQFLANVLALKPQARRTGFVQSLLTEEAGSWQCWCPPHEPNLSVAGFQTHRPYTLLTNGISMLTGPSSPYSCCSCRGET